MTTEQPMLPADFPEPVLTCDLIIKRELTEAFTSQEHWIDAMRESHNYAVGDKSDAAMAAQYKSLMFLQAFIQSAAITDLLQTIQRMAPGLADGIARDFDNLHESGEVGEWLWEWATERGLDPEAIIEETRAKIAFDKKAATPCADKSIAKGAAREVPAESGPKLSFTELVVDTTDYGFRALTSDEVTASMNLPREYLPGASFIKQPHPSHEAELTSIDPNQATTTAEVIELAQYFEGVPIDGTHEETQIYAKDALELATILHAAGYRKTEGTK